MLLVGIILKILRNYNIIFELLDFKDIVVNKEGYRNVRGEIFINI